MQQKIHKKTLLTKVVGLYYAQAENLAAVLPHNTILEVIPEPANKYDHNAVAVYYAAQKLGYIPRSMNHIIQKFLSLKFNCMAFSRKFHPKQLTSNLDIYPAYLEIEIHFFKNKFYWQ